MYYVTKETNVRRKANGQPITLSTDFADQKAISQNCTEPNGERPSG